MADLESRAAGWVDDELATLAHLLQAPDPGRSSAFLDALAQLGEAIA